MEIKSRPILFSSEMIRAILDGKKSMTRRIIKPQPHDINDRTSEEVNAAWQEGFVPVKCPYGTVGDVLWVREGFTILESNEIIYKADSSPAPYGLQLLPDGSYFDGRWKPSIHMPRWASRITLEITDIRVERLQDISEEDAKAEGLKAITKDGGITIKYGIPDTDGLPGTDNFGWQWQDWHIDPRMAYKLLWESINGAGSWEVNPFVWVIQFKPHLVNVDDYIAALGGV